MRFPFWVRESTTTHEGKGGKAARAQRKRRKQQREGETYHPRWLPATATSGALAKASRSASAEKRGNPAAQPKATSAHVEKPTLHTSHSQKNVTVTRLRDTVRHYKTHFPSQAPKLPRGCMLLFLPRLAFAFTRRWSLENLRPGIARAASRRWRRRLLVHLLSFIPFAVSFPFSLPPIQLLTLLTASFPSLF